MSQMLKFKTVLGVLDCKLYKNSMYFARFSGLEAIAKLNELDEELINGNLFWNTCFGHKLSEDLIIPSELLDTKVPITQYSILALRNSWNESIKNNESLPTRYKILDQFAKKHTISKNEIARYYRKINASSSL